MKFGSRALALLFLLLLASVAWGEKWTQNGATWTHPFGLSITFPEEFHLVQDEHGELTATNKRWVELVFTPIRGEKSMKEAMEGVAKTRQATGMTLKGEPRSGNQNGLEWTSQEGSSKNANGIPLYVKMGIFNKKEKDAYLFVQLVEPQQLLEMNAPALKKVFGSIK